MPFISKFLYNASRRFLVSFIGKQGYIILKFGTIQIPDLHDLRNKWKSVIVFNQLYIFNNGLVLVYVKIK